MVLYLVRKFRASTKDTIFLARVQSLGCNTDPWADILLLECEESLSRVLQKMIVKPLTPHLKEYSVKHCVYSAEQIEILMKH